MSRLAEIAGVLTVWLICMALFLAGIDLPWVIVIALIGLVGLAAISTRGRR